MSFAEQYRADVVPRLARIARVQGLFLACGLTGFDEAWGEVFAEARRLGALHLPEALRDDLMAWVTSTVLAETIEAENRHGIGAARASR